MATENDALTQAWSKISGIETPEMGRAGVIPVFDTTYGNWRLFRNLHTIYEPAENCADPVKVETLRRNASNLIARYPDTIPALEKLGLRVKRILNSPIKTPEDVAAWATSIFNVSPINREIPAHVIDTLALVYDDFTLMLPTRPPTFVVPAMPRGSGNSSVVTFDTPYGKRKKLGPRSDQAKMAFVTQEAEKASRRPRKPAEAPEAPVPPVGAQETPTAAPKRRGRPRADGLESGSLEAKAADAAKRKAARLRRAQMVQPETGATITELHPAEPEVEEPAPERRRLMRRPIS